MSKGCFNNEELGLDNTVPLGNVVKIGEESFFVDFFLTSLDILSKGCFKNAELELDNTVPLGNVKYVLWKYGSVSGHLYGFFSCLLGIPQ